MAPKSPKQDQQEFSKTPLRPQEFELRLAVHGPVDALVMGMVLCAQPPGLDLRFNDCGQVDFSAGWTGGPLCTGVSDASRGASANKTSPFHGGNFTKEKSGDLFTESLKGVRMTCL